MELNQFQIKHNKKTLDLTALGLIHYRQSKILESADEQGNYYYLFFYKNDFLTGIQTHALTTDSYIKRAYQNGIHFHGTHPITLQYLQQQPFTFLSLKQHEKNIQKSYSSLESILISTYFDSFLKEDSLTEALKKTFNDYRRNGKVFASYQLLKLFLDAVPNHKFASDMMGDIQYKRYESSYNDPDFLYEKDPLYFELTAFDHMHESPWAEKLLALYQKQNRTLDELSLRIALLKQNFTNEAFHTVRSNISAWPQEEQLRLLLELNQNINAPVLKETVFNQLLETEDANRMVHVMMTTDFTPNEVQLSSMIHQLGEADSEVLASYFHNANTTLLKYADGNGQTLEKLVNPFIASYLNNYDLPDIIDWLAPFSQAGYHLPIEQKLKKMNTFREDPDQQFALGELYLEFHQSEKAIDCFKWEMELNPEDPKPVTHLSKLYTKIGKPNEAAAYQQLLKQMRTS